MNGAVDKVLYLTNTCFPKWKSWLNLHWMKLKQ